MNLDERKCKKMFRLVGSPLARDLLKFISRDEAKTYTQMIKRFGINRGRSNSGTAYYLKLFLELKLVCRDKNTRTYYLSRLGVRILDLVDEFEGFCIEYDIADADQNGKVKMICVVEGRKN